MLSRIGRFFRRLGGDQDRPKDRPPTTEQDQPTSQASRQQDESDLLAQDVIGRTRSIAVSDRSIHQARSVAVTDTRPMVSPARPQERRDIPTEALPFAAPRETLSPVESIPGGAESSVGTIFEDGSTGDSEWDALWHLRGTARASSQPATPAPASLQTGGPSALSDAPASPAPPTRGSVQRTPEPGPTGGEGIPGAEPEPLVQDASQPEISRAPAAPTARPPAPRPAVPTVPQGEVQRRSSPSVTNESSGENALGPAQRQELDNEPPEMETPATDVGPERAVSSVPPAPVQRPSPSVESPAVQHAHTPLQRTPGEPRPSLPSYPLEGDDLQPAPDMPAAPPESAVQPGRQSVPGPHAPAQPAVQRQVAPASVPAREPDVLPPDVVPQSEAAPSPQPETVQPTPAGAELVPERIPISQSPLQRQPSLETPASEPIVDTGVEVVEPEEAPSPSRTVPAVPSAPPAARSTEPAVPVPEPTEIQEPPAMTGSLPRLQTPAPAPVPPATPGIQRTVEPETAPVLAPEPAVRPEPVVRPGLPSLPPAEVAPPGVTRAPAVQRMEATEPFHAQPVQREPEPAAAPPVPGLPKDAYSASEGTADAEPTPDVVQQHVDQREALRQALQPRIVPTVVQRAVEERETEPTSSAGAETGSEAEGEQGPNIEALAKDVYRILRKKLLVERERDLGRI